MMRCNVGESGVRTYRDLEVWQRGMELVEAVYDLARKFPDEERYGLTSQMRRSAVSIPANVAEGHGRSHKKEYVHHVSFARGSLCELETLLILAVRLGYAEEERSRDAWRLCQDVGMMLNRLLAALKHEK
jgi:four helix bundle protein